MPLVWAPLYCCLLFLPQPVFAQWLGALEAGAIFDDNLSRSELSADIESDRGLWLLAEGGRAFHLAAGNALTFTGSLEFTGFDQFRGMRNLAAGLSGSWRKRFGLGAEAPALGALVSVQRLEFSDSKRDGWFYLGEIRWSQRPTERWEIEAAGSYEVRRADAALAKTVFNQERLGASVLGNVALGQAWLLSLGYAYLTGDVDSNATPNDRIIAARKASIEDPVFGNGRLVYRLEANVHSLSLDLTRAVTRNSSLVLGYGFQAIRAQGGIDYERNQVKLSYVYVF